MPKQTNKQVTPVRVFYSWQSDSPAETNLKAIRNSLDKVEGNCAACHSLGYIAMNSVYLNPAGWDAEVTKMIKAFGAPIDDADAKAIADYLKKNGS